MAIADYLSGINRATEGQKTDVSNAAKDLSTLQVGAGSLPSKLKEALNTKLNNNKDIINQQSETMQGYFNSGAQAREKYQDVFNPFEKAKLVQQDRSMALRPYDTLSGVLENRMGTVADTVTAGVQGWQGLVNAATTKAELAKSNLQTALSSYFKAADMQSAADDMAFKKAQAEEASRQFNLNYGLDVKKVDNQMDQFNRELALKAASMRNGSGGLSQADKDKLTAQTWTKIMEDSKGDLGQVWNQIHANEGIWNGAGVNVQSLWNQWKANGGGQPSPAPQQSQISKLFGGGNSYANTQLDLSTGKVVGNPVAPVSVKLKPGDPGYAPLSNKDYLKGYNIQVQ